MQAICCLAGRATVLPVLSSLHPLKRRHFRSHYAGVLQQVRTPGQRPYEASSTRLDSHIRNRQLDDIVSDAWSGRMTRGGP
jgi:hypothetical protein